MKVLACFAAVAATSCQPAPPEAPHYQIVPDATNGAWRIDTRTGKVNHCVTGADAYIACVPER